MPNLTPLDIDGWYQQEPDPVPDQTMWRTLIHLRRVSPIRLLMRIPGFSGYAEHPIAPGRVPLLVIFKMDAAGERGRYFHVRINISAESFADLRFEDWELE